LSVRPGLRPIRRPMARVVSGVIQPSILDTWVKYKDSDEPHGDENAMDIANDPAGVDRQALVKFDIDDLPSTIRFATLGLYAFAGIVSLINIQALRITSSWDETVTWNTQPTYGYLADSITLIRGQWNEWDVTPIIQYGKDHPSEWFGIYLRHSPYAQVGTISVYAREEPIQLSKRPKLTWEGIG